MKRFLFFNADGVAIGQLSTNNVTDIPDAIVCNGRVYERFDEDATGWAFREIGPTLQVFYIGPIPGDAPTFQLHGN